MSNDNGNGTALAQRGGGGASLEIATGFNSRHIEIIKSMYAKNASQDEFTVFIALCQRDNLDPLRKEAFFIKYGTDLIMMTSRDGYLKICLSDPDFLGVTSMAVKEGDHFELDAIQGSVTHRFGAKRGALIGAYAIAKHRRRDPIVTFAEFSEYDKKEKNPVWRNYPSAMICKVAEVMALKRIGGISGWTTQEEMGTREEFTEADFRPLPASGPPSSLPPQAASRGVQGHPAGGAGQSGDMAGGEAGAANGAQIAEAVPVKKAQADLAAHLKAVGFESMAAIRNYISQEVGKEPKDLTHEEIRGVRENLDPSVIDLATGERIPDHVLNPDAEETVDTETGEITDADFTALEEEADEDPFAGIPDATANLSREPTATEWNTRYLAAKKSLYGTDDAAAKAWITSNVGAITAANMPKIALALEAELARTHGGRAAA